MRGPAASLRGACSWDPQALELANPCGPCARPAPSLPQTSRRPSVEFFCAPDKLEALLQRLEGSPSVTYLAVNAKGEMRSNTDGEGGANAVTWGVFPGAGPGAGVGSRAGQRGLLAHLL